MSAARSSLARTKENNVEPGYMFVGHDKFDMFDIQPQNELTRSLSRLAALPADDCDSRRSD